jgi:hypothetical protein
MYYFFSIISVAGTTCLQGGFMPIETVACPTCGTSVNVTIPTGEKLDSVLRRGDFSRPFRSGEAICSNGHDLEIMCSPDE